MKIKFSFITNSSSSSFVIAIKEGFKLSDLQNAIEENVKEFISGEYADEHMEEYVGDFENLSEDDKLKEAVRVISELILEMVTDKSALKLDDWTVIAGTASSEDFDLPGSFLYQYSIEDTDFIKSKDFYS